FSYSFAHHRHLPSFPTRRSSDLTAVLTAAAPLVIRIYSSTDWRAPEVAAQYDSMIMLAYYCMPQIFFYGVYVLAGQVLNARDRLDRKSTRLNSSHDQISYAVFCL